MRIFSAFLVVLLLSAAPSGAQISRNDLYTPNRKVSCADTVSPAELMKSADLAFTGRVVKRNANFTWFRIYKKHHGHSRNKIVKTAGFYVNEPVMPGQGQSYETGKVYTVVLNKPRSAEEHKFGVDYINALSQCEEAVISKIHDRFGNYRVQSSALQPGTAEKIGNHFYFMKGFYLVLLLGAAIAGAGFRYRDKIPLPGNAKTSD